VSGRVYESDVPPADASKGVGSSFGRRLGRLRSFGDFIHADDDFVARSPEPAVEQAPERTDAGTPRTPIDAATPRTPIDELRDRIAAVIARGATCSSRTVARPRPRKPDADETSLGSSCPSLPFIEEETPLGPLHLAQKRTPIASRFGVAPLYPAVLADPTMLALLALDPALERCDPKRALYIDTETTGLGGGTGSVAFLIGLAHFDERRESFVIEQLLLNHLGEEAPMLDHLARRIDEASMIVTFNGKSFDMPLLRARAVMNRLPPFMELPHLDLLHVARRIHGTSVASCALKRIEEDVLGHARFEDVCGQEIYKAYFHFVRTRDESVLGGVVEHNMSDVLAMVALTGFYGEPLGALGARDLAGVATTLRRAGALDRALHIADAAVERGGGACARRVRGDIERARGDKLRAITEYEAASEELEDPSLRLALAKLYEHAARSFDKALGMVMQGTSERPDAQEKRRSRLVRKLESVAEPTRAKRRPVARKAK
jgi:uncharacterized protein